RPSPAGLSHVDDLVVGNDLEGSVAGKERVHVDGEVYPDSWLRTAGGGRLAGADHVVRAGIGDLEAGDDSKCADAGDLISRIAVAGGNRPGVMENIAGALSTERRGSHARRRVVIVGLQYNRLIVVSR